MRKTVILALALVGLCGCMPELGRSYGVICLSETGDHGGTLIAIDGKGDKAKVTLNSCEGICAKPATSNLKLVDDRIEFDTAKTAAGAPALHFVGRFDDDGVLIIEGRSAEGAFGPLRLEPTKKAACPAGSKRSKAP